MLGLDWCDVHDCYLQTLCASGRTSAMSSSMQHDIDTDGIIGKDN
jgi:hypothetical protein